jgi:uncharacterized protein (DUF1015 family)
MNIKPFKAYRFNQDVGGDPGTCIAPPYDVIDAPHQRALYEQNPYNIVRAIKGQKRADDSDVDNVYTRAADYLHKAIEDGALVQDEKDAIYVYVQDFEIGGKQYERTGIIALGMLTQFGEGVRPHEKTLEGPKADRLNLTRATACQLGQIFMLYDDPTNIDHTIIAKTQTKEAVIDMTDDQGARHRLFVIDEPEVIADFVRMMADKHTVIADGHHRYETALNYRAETKDEQAAWQMMTFVNMRNEGLVIQPTHRLLVNMPDFDVRALLDELTGEFEVTEFAFSDSGEKLSAKENMFTQMQQAGAQNENVFGLYAGGNAFYTILLKNHAAMAEMCPDMSEAAQGLDVNVLHKLILEKHLGICEVKLAGESHLVYIKDLGDAIDKSIAAVDGGDSEGVFFMNATHIEQVEAVAGAGEKMPQKSTFFYPKIFSGLTVRKLDIEPIQPQLNHSHFIRQECSK